MNDQRRQDAGGGRLFVGMLITTAVVVSGLAVLLSGRLADPDDRRVLSDAALLGGSAIAALATARAAWRSSGALRLPWLLLTANALCWTVGNTFWFYYQNIAPSQPFPSLADVFYIGAIPFGVAGLLSFHGGRRVRIDRFRAVLDALIVASGLVAASSAVVLRPIWEASTATGLGLLALIVPPVGDVVIASVALLLVANLQAGHRMHLALLGAGYLIYAVSDSTYAYLGSQGAFAIGSPLDLGWIGGYLIVALAAVAPTATRPPPSLDRASSASVASALIVYGAMLGVVVAVATDPAPHNHLEVGLPGLASVILFGVRQVLLSAENGRLHRDLASKVVERTRELERLSRRSERILGSVADGLYGTDLDGRIVFVNAAAAELLRYAEDDLVGRSAQGLVDTGDSAPGGAAPGAAPSPLLLALNNGVTVRDQDATYRRRDGTAFPVELTASPIVESGRITGAVVAFRDISERRAVDRMKNEFVSVVSHELRTPLTSIRGSLGLIDSGKLGELPEAAGRMVRIALQSSERLTRLINDILDLERISSGAVPLALVDVAAADLVAQTVAALRPVAEEAGVRLRVDEVDGRVYADSDRVIQTLTNLVGNAVKFSPPGATVSLGTWADDEMVEFHVADEGRGIPADKLETIFDRFQQVDSSDSREKGGTGLGLAICRSIVERHGGRIWADSIVDHGSTFRFTLPKVVDRRPAPVPATAVGAAGAAGDSRPVVLVVDDDTSVLAMLAEILDRRGFRVVTVTRAEDALELAAAVQPRVLLLDLRMPTMSGQELMARLRQRPETAKIPVVVMSVVSPAEDPALARSVAGWVTKPADEQVISDAVRGAAEDHGPGGRAPHVLVVEDDDHLAEVLVEVIGRHGVQVDRAATEAAAVAMSHRHPPDVLVLDLGLPDGDGYEVVAALRGNGSTAGVPVGVDSASEVAQADRTRLRLGHTEFLTKSRVSTDEVGQRVAGLIGRLAGPHTPAPPPERVGASATVD